MNVGEKGKKTRGTDNKGGQGVKAREDGIKLEGKRAVAGSKDVETMIGGMSCKGKAMETGG